MKNTLLLLSILSLNFTFAQTVNSSKAFIKSCYHGQQCFALSEAAYIFYNEGNHELIVTLDFAKFKIGQDTLDNWLDDLDDTKLIFKGTLQSENLLVLTHHNSKAIVVNGIMTFNNISHAHSIELTIFEIKQDGLLYVNNSQDYYDRINANLQFAFSPKEFKIDKKPLHLKKTISVAIYRGLINQFKPGMENLIIHN
jgi:hypothetical protein